ncbi:class I SAM-dependent methyltransferase [Colwellia sp. BRX10-3]|uniref:class I SAM-dependent methyltransferase n=1 Tax=Colwellia sp. BRX10-3 TaxID=2759844 RepID=UPI0015F74CAB|nr:class I SAM-dependent methyltransferase [Colwellia sp. BRX10-3]MBA6390008.1 class I SAM-dependent methyltransferase [Colwellia sp. BRX10-3]
MQYLLNDNVVKSENAAKPHSQKAKDVHDYLISLGKVNKTLDFGCGKLRYADSIVEMSESVTFLDSKIQLTRQQMVKNEKTSVANYVSNNYLNCDCVPYEDVDKIQTKFDLIVCTNVISAIPCPETIQNIFRIFSDLISSNGKVIVINQHRSSYFKKFESGEKHLFGYLYESRRGTSYYGIITKTVVKDLVAEHDIEVVNDWVSGDITFSEIMKSLNPGCEEELMT